MGVMARKQDELFIITSDRISGDLPSKRAPRMSENLQVWTGDRWSSDMADAKTFTTLDEADEYVRTNYAQVMTDG